METFILFIVLVAIIGSAFSTVATGALAAFFIMGSLPFYALILWFFIVVTVEIENDREGQAFFSVAAMLLIFQLYVGIPMFQYFWADPAALLIFAVSYFALGTAWSFWKWFLFVKDKRKEYDKKKAEYDSDKGLASDYGRTYADWADCVDDQRIGRPLASKYKTKITGWMTFWPWSALWFLINDPVRRAFKWIFERFEGTYQRISDLAYAGTDAPNEDED